MVDPSSLDRALEAIRSNYGASSVRMGDTFDDPKRIPTGSLELDLILKGGVPLGRWCHWYGGQFSGKSLLALNTIANAQKLGYTCALYNIEKQYTASWAEKHGVDTEKLIVVDTTKIEDIGIQMETLLSSVHIHVLDSLAAAISIDELAAGVDEWRPGITARAWGKVLRRVNERFNQEENTIIMINHMGTAFGKYTAEEPKGGRFLEYMSSLSIGFRRTAWLYRDKNGNLKDDGQGEASLSGDKEPAGIEFAARVQKSRVSTPFKTARLRLDFKDGEFDNGWSLAKAALHYGVVSKTSAKSSWIDMPDGTKVQGDGQLREYMEANPDFKQLVIETIEKDGEQL